MNYSDSRKILEKVKAAKRILLSCHRSPDLDSVASVMALKKVLTAMGKKVVVFCPDPIPQVYKFIPGAKDIALMDPKEINFSDFDLWFFADTESFSHVGLGNMIPDINKVNIDHHPGSTINAQVGIIDPLGSSTCELLYLVFKDWKMIINDSLATTLLAGIIQDTNFFQQKNTTAKTHKVTYELMNLGADNNYLAYKVKRCNEYGLVKLWGEFGNALEIDTKNKFVWSAIPYRVFKKANITGSATAEYASSMARTIEGTNFCIVMAEKKPKQLTMSIRARVAGFDVRPIAAELGGGGHKDACGAGVMGLPFKEAVEKVLGVARKHAGQKFTPEIPVD